MHIVSRCIYPSGAITSLICLCRHSIYYPHPKCGRNREGLLYIPPICVLCRRVCTYNIPEKSGPSLCLPHPCWRLYQVVPLVTSVGPRGCPDLLYLPTWLEHCTHGARYKYSNCRLPISCAVNVSARKPKPGNREFQGILGMEERMMSGFTVCSYMVHSMTEVPCVIFVCS